MIGALIGAGASILGSIFGSKKQKVTNEVDYVKMVKNAEAAGFNPLTALRNGGAAGFSVSSGGGASPLSAIADGIAGAADFLQNFDPHADQKRELEFDLVQAQLENLQADTQSKIRFGQVPAYTATPNARVMGASAPRNTNKAASIARVLPDSAGAARTPQIENPRIVNPWGDTGLVVDPNVPNADAFEERYGDSEVFSTLSGLYVAGRDFVQNLPAMDYTAPIPPSLAAEYKKRSMKTEKPKRQKPEVRFADWYQ